MSIKPPLSPRCPIIPNPCLPNPPMPIPLWCSFSTDFSYLILLFWYNVISFDIRSFFIESAAWWYTYILLLLKFLLRINTYLRSSSLRGFYIVDWIEFKGNFLLLDIPLEKFDYLNLVNFKNLWDFARTNWRVRSQIGRESLICQNTAEILWQRSVFWKEWQQFA